MRYRKQMSMRDSKNYFERTSGTHVKNVRRMPARGGIRL